MCKLHVGLWNQSYQGVNIRDINLQCEASLRCYAFREKAGLAWYHDVTIGRDDQFISRKNNPSLDQNMHIEAIKIPFLMTPKPSLSGKNWLSYERSQTDSPLS